MNPFFDNFTLPQTVLTNSSTGDLGTDGSFSATSRSLSTIGGSNNVSATIGTTIGKLIIQSNSVGIGVLDIRYLEPIGGLTLTKGSIITIQIDTSLTNSFIVTS